MLGSKTGIKPDYSQAIHAEDIADPGLRTFGYSLSGGMDVDSNTYNDLLIGAYHSDRVILMKARPVVNVTATLTTTKDNVNLEDRDCTTSDGNRALCVTIKVCLSYSGVGVDNRLGNFFSVCYYYFLNDPLIHAFIFLGGFRIPLPYNIRCKRFIKYATIIFST